MDQILEGLKAQMSLTDLEQQRVCVPVDVWNESALNHDLCLVGRVLSWLEYSPSSKDAETRG